MRTRAGRVGGSPSPTASPDPSPPPSPSPSPTSGFEPLRFAVIGDFGVGDDVQQGIADRMCDYRKDHPFDLVITTGDNIYPDGSKSLFASEFKDPYSCLLDDGVSFHASIGNHDYSSRRGKPEIHNTAFGIKHRNYVVRKDGVRFVIADSDELDMQWLEDKTKAKDGDRWTVVVFHFPVYSPGTGHGSTPGYRPDLPRIFRKNDVDLVLNGHDHIYSVSKRLHKIRYVVTGGGGASTYGCSDQDFSAVCRSRNHFLYVVAKKERIVVRAIPAEGKKFDKFKTAGRD